MLRAKQVGHQVLIVILAISTKITLPAVVIQIVPTQTRTYSLEPWLVDQETRMTSKLLATISSNPCKSKSYLFFAPPFANLCLQFPILSYNDARNDYVMNEVALDYNSGFQMAVAGLLNDVVGQDLEK